MVPLRRRGPFCPARVIAGSACVCTANAGFACVSGSVAKPAPSHGMATAAPRDLIKIPLASLCCRAV
jgi:hypothetical protein